MAHRYKKRASHPFHHFLLKGVEHHSCRKTDSFLHSTWSNLFHPHLLVSPYVRMLVVAPKPQMNRNETTPNDTKNILDRI